MTMVFIAFVVLLVLILLGGLFGMFIVNSVRDETDDVFYDDEFDYEEYREHDGVKY